MVVVVGSLNVDTVVRLERCPEAGETVAGSGTERHRGGKGANQAYAVARLGGVVRMVGRVGADTDGEWLLEGLESGRVDVGQVGRGGEETGSAQIWVDAAGENRIVVVAGANGAMRAAELDPRVFAGAGVVLLQLEVPMSVVLAAVRAGRQSGAVVVLDPAPVPAGGVPDEVMACVDFLTPNEGELEALGGDVDQLLGRGVGNVVVKRGAQGATSTGEAGEFAWASPVVEVVDTTAAGDAWNGAFGFALARGESVEAAGAFACRAAAVSVTRRGAQVSMAGMEQLEKAGE